MKKKHKRFWYTITEEGVLNPAYFGYAGGRIEVWDSKSGSSYPMEYRFLIPEELMPGFREWIDCKESAKSIYIDMTPPLVLNKIRKEKK